MTDILDDFLEEKKADSEWVSLLDGESVHFEELLGIDTPLKSGFGGEIKRVVRVIGLVETVQGLRKKQFDNGTAKFAKQIVEKFGNKRIGISFTVTRNGSGPKTTYAISDVKELAAGAISSNSSKASDAYGAEPDFMQPADPDESFNAASDVMGVPLPTAPRPASTTVTPAATPVSTSTPAASPTPSK